MTTYVVNFDLAAAETNVSGQYPTLAGDSDFLPDCTILVKAGDTIRFTTNQIDGGSNTGNITYQNTSNYDTDPDPDGFNSSTMNNQTKSSPCSWEYTVGTGNEDKYFAWFFWGSVSASNPSNKKYSQRVEVVRVDGLPKMNNNTTAVNVDQGGSLTFSVTGLNMYHEDDGAQLTTTANLSKNKLYFSVLDLPHGSTNPSPSVVLVQNYTNGGWSGSSNQLGKVWNGSTSVTLNIGDNMPTGTYYAYLTHYNPLGINGDLANSSSSPGGNPYYGAENRLGPNGSSHGTSAAALQFTVQAPTQADSDPDQFDLRYSTAVDNVANAIRNQTYESTAVNLTGFNQTVQPTITGGQYSVNGGSWQVGTNNSRDSVQSGDNIKVKGTANGAYGGTTNVVLTIGTTSDTWTITTQQNPASGGADIVPPTGTSDYGLAVYNSAGTQQIFGPTMRALHVLAYGNIPSIGAINSATQYYGFAGYTSLPAITIAAPTAQQFNGSSSSVVSLANNNITLTGSQASSWVVNAPVTYTTTGTAIGGLSNGATYYVKTKTGDAISLSGTSGGSEINLTGYGAGTSHSFTGQTATATSYIISGSVSKATVTLGGSGYTSAPAISFSGGGGSGAAATAAISAGAVTGITITDGGSANNTHVENMTTANGTGGEDTIGVIIGGDILASALGSGWSFTYYDNYFRLRNLSSLGYTNIKWYAVRY